MKEQIYDNLFSANHRTTMIERYGYTDAMSVTVGQLQGSIEPSEPSCEPDEAHECTLDLKGYCRGCEAIWEFLHQ